MSVNSLPAPITPGGQPLALHRLPWAWPVASSLLLAAMLAAPTALTLARLPQLSGRDLQCWCPLTSPWCHAEILLHRANPQAQVLS